MKRSFLAVVTFCCLISSTADDAVNVSRVAAWALQRREERIRRWLPSQPFNRTGFRLVPVPPKLERGFLLVAIRVENHHAIDATSSSQLRLLDGVHDLCVHDSLVHFHTGGDEVARRTPAAERVHQ